MARPVRPKRRYFIRCEYIRPRFVSAMVVARRARDGNRRNLLLSQAIVAAAFGEIARNYRCSVLSVAADAIGGSNPVKRVTAGLEDLWGCVRGPAEHEVVVVRGGETHPRNGGGPKDDVLHIVVVITDEVLGQACERDGIAAGADGSGKGMASSSATLERVLAYECRFTRSKFMAVNIFGAGREISGSQIRCATRKDNETPVSANQRGK